MQEFKLHFSDITVFSPTNEVLKSTDTDAPFDSYTSQQVRYKGKDGLILGYTGRRKTKLITLEKSITDPKYEYGYFYWIAQCALGYKMVELGMRWDVSDFNVWYDHLQGQFNKATGARAKNNDPF